MKKNISLSHSLNFFAFDKFIEASMKDKISGALKNKWVRESLKIVQLNLNIFFQMCLVYFNIVAILINIKK